MKRKSYVKKAGETNSVRNQIILDVGKAIAENGWTVRQAAAYFGIGKSTVHFYMRKNLPALNRDLYDQVDHVLNQNLSERAIRGGLSTGALQKNLARSIHR